MELSEETMNVLEEICVKKGIPIDECLEHYQGRAFNGEETRGIEKQLNEWNLLRK